MKIEKKTWPAQFEALLSGTKKFDCRLADFAPAEGDTVIFEEWDPEKKAYTGRKLEKKITYILNTKEAEFWTEEEKEKKGFLVMSLE